MKKIIRLLLIIFISSQSNAQLYTKKVSEGNYEVSIILKGVESNAKISINVENRRLLILNKPIQENSLDTIKFLVNVRDSFIHATNEVLKLKSNERFYNHWDDKLNLEFIGKGYKIESINVDTLRYYVPTIYLIGNSTVVDQPIEPWTAWGQMLPCMLNSEKIIVANYAESGETIKAFIREKRFKKILSLAQPGDYVFIEFAHNDQKQGENHLEPFGDYSDSLHSLINQCRNKLLNPILVTSTARRFFDSLDNVIETLGDYPNAMRNVAKKENVPIVDLNTMTKEMYAAWGIENSKRAFVHFPIHSFPGQIKELKDNTHFTSFGAYEVARCVVYSLYNLKTGIEYYIIDNYRRFNPKDPDVYQNICLPISSISNIVLPDGN